MDDYRWSTADEGDRSHLHGVVVPLRLQEGLSFQLCQLVSHVIDNLLLAFPILIKGRYVQLRVRKDDLQQSTKST
jgi:hypothetical protein